jgi:hypothetical protein
LRDASGNIIPNTAETVVIDILQGGASGTMAMFVNLYKNSGFYSA